MEFSSGSAVIIISASIDNTYLLFGYKETSQTLSRSTELVNVYALESTVVKPKYDIYPPGLRAYYLKDWEDVGADSSDALLKNSESMDLLHFASDLTFSPGDVPIQ